MKKIANGLSVRIPKRLERVLLYVGGILLVAVVYVFVFQKLQVSNEELKNQVSKLTTENEQLIQMKNDQKSHEEDIKKFSKEIERIVNDFPADALEEDAVMFANQLEINQAVSVSDIYYANRNRIKKGKKSGYILYATPVEYTFTSGYESLKNMVAEILRADEKKNVENINLSYDSESGKLRGTLMMNEYSLTGDGRQYQPKDIGDVATGNANPFATAE